MHVTRLLIERLRTIERCEIDFCVPPLKTQVGSSQAGDGPLPNVTLLLGTNGAGKTTVLRAIAMTALAPLLPQSSGYVPRSMVRRTGRKAARSARVTATLRFSPQDGQKGAVESRLTLRSVPGGYQDKFEVSPEPPWAKRMWIESSPAFFIVGYGASRRVDSGGAFGFQRQEKERNLRYLRVAGLFEESVVLRPLSSWLPNWENPGRRKQLVTMLNQILPEVELVDEPVDGEYLFRVGGSELPFDALSDGYRAFIGWVVDLLYHVSRGAPRGQMLFETSGIVLVDEVDLHLHPAWQRTVIPRLARTMPNVQFVFTSHSPLVVGTLHRENVRVVRAHHGGAQIEPPSIEVHGLSADQILTSEYFGLESTREPRFAARMSKVAGEARRGDAGQAQQFLRMLTLGAGAEVARGSTDSAPPARRKRARKTSRPERAR